jgi:predicted ATPase
MIRLIEAMNFRCLRYVRQPVGSFHVLVGPNASGKTTFLDVVGFLGRLVSGGIDTAIGEHTKNFQDMVFGRKGDCFELAVEAAIPDMVAEKLPEDQRARFKEEFDTIRYEVRVGIDASTHEVGILGERAWLRKWGNTKRQESLVFPAEHDSPDTVLTDKARPGWRRVLTKARGGNDNFYVEGRKEGGGKGWFPSIKLGPHRSALGNLPQDESKFPAAMWLKTLLIQGVQSLVLNSRLIRNASPPGQMRGFKPDGSNLPWVVAELEKSPSRFRSWVSHLRTALPDVEGIRVVEREEDRHRYLVIRYRGGLEVPSWMVSDGTLRLLALTILAYLPETRGVYLIEEPENGIHPRAVEAIFNSLSSVYDAQSFLATHSPVILSLAKPDKVLCFEKTKNGATDIVLGSEHPKLRKWKGETDLGTLLVAGVLG